MNNRLFRPLVISTFLFAALTARSAPDKTRAEFLKIIDRPRVALAQETSPLVETNGSLQGRFSFTADAQQRVPGILVKQRNSSGRLPVVIALHGTGGTKEGQLPLLRSLAGKGFLAVAIDGRYHGERAKGGRGADYNEAILQAWRGVPQHPFYYDTVWDVMRLIAYLEMRDDVDPKRIGLIGFSKGGIETYLAAAVEPRIAVAVPCIGVQSFGWALEHNAWKPRIGTIKTAFDSASKEAGVAEPDAAFVRKFYDRVAPGIYSQFDGPAMLPLIAPRPLQVINGDSDDKTPVPGINLCADAARKAYSASHAEDRFRLIVQKDTGHKVTAAAQEDAIEWFVKWLKAEKTN
jgi:dienelactone hydrolase